MKLLEAINETQEERLLKRAKTIFRALKEGIITRSDGVSFSYVINNNIEVRVKNGEIELYGFVSKIVERTYCPINERYMTELIAKRFRRFGIITELTMPKKENVHKYQGKKPWEIIHQDTMEMWKFGDRRSYTSLELLAELMGISGVKTDLSGDQVNRVFYKENGLARINVYCLEDVIVVAQLYLRFHFLDLVAPENIVKL